MEGPAHLGRQAFSQEGDDPTHATDNQLDSSNKDVEMDTGPPNSFVERPKDVFRQTWLAIAWTLTFWIPSFVLRKFGHMSRRDVRMAWREKLSMVTLIAMLNAGMIFTMVYIGHYALLILSILFSAVTSAKALCAIRFSSKPTIASQSDFVLCLITTYNEDEEEIRRSINSVAQAAYDDKRKLLCVICDGIVTARGNDSRTDTIVLDIMGVNHQIIDPEPLMFQSIGSGSEKLNLGKLYSGLYEVKGHIVPFIVIVKVGKPSELHKPGQRGKRDSQVLIFSFLKRVHYNEPMSPLELEIYHHMRNIIGVNPAFYSLLLMVDADTMIESDSISLLVGGFNLDIGTSGICGETMLTNGTSRFWSLIQVYEYDKAFRETKAFESLFGSVTCLPGCFCMYRIYCAESHEPILTSREIISSYASTDVSTLHTKNLLTLGEDRYLTTLLLKHHPQYKTRFLAGARASTKGAKNPSAFFTQRRRWINSTLHNSLELLRVRHLCGICDLPATATSLVYLLYREIAHPDLRTRISVCLVAAPYGLQAVSYLAKRRPLQILWMLAYLITFPLWMVALPVYSFWKQDDFTWGGARTVCEDKKRRKAVAGEVDSQTFDASFVPMKRWVEYEAELFEGYNASSDDEIGESEEGMCGQSAAGYLPQGAADVEMREMNVRFPSDEQLVEEIRDILSTADLFVVTKQDIRRELERRFGVPLDVKRAFIGRMAEEVLCPNLARYP